ncbi:hypothetical protein GCM10007276_15220 [Agaricicola taiwanensis]|uniref:DUF899 domain-containing protein n=1 Tax=Agaricicola taiwanensis TaxID=591372 RepID=A0A8J2VUV1_9RHOB|nr:thioredoxin family protein [Agaricicola taiwanensis]GGE38847.1 hypothetical protein GCM10007276_15220 [Agaricicola taiwanensis]
MPNHQVVGREEWLKARRVLLAREKEAVRLRDAINAERLALPWVKVEEDYLFDTADGPKRLSELFAGRSQLMVYHFMLAPGWDAGCDGCSFLADHFDGTLPHLNAHDVTLIAISRAPLSEIEAYRMRMGWKFPWASSIGNRFNYDYQVSFTEEDLARGKVTYNYRETDAAHVGPENPGLSAFYCDADGTVFHTYSSYARGPEELIGTFMILDRAPLGRNEGTIMDWVRRHDEYEVARETASCCHS